MGDKIVITPDNSLEHSTKFKHFHLMGSASKMEIRVLHRIHPFPRIFLKKIKWIISEGVHTNATIFTSSIKVGTKYLYIFLELISEVDAFKTEKIDLDREASSKKCVET